MRQLLCSRWIRCRLIGFRSSSVTAQIGTGADADKLRFVAREAGAGTIAVTGTDSALFGAATAGAAETVNANGTVAKSVDELVTEINRAKNADQTDNALFGKIRASNDNGKLRIENLSTSDLSIGGATTGNVVDGTTAAGTSSAEIGGNTVRADLAKQFNELRDQLDKLADDASFNGINLLRGDNLQITFNETGTSEINIQTKEAKTINSTNLGIQTTIEASQLDDDSSIDDFLSEIKGAINDVRSQSSAFGSNLSVVQNRQDFTKNMINTLQTGAANLTLADSNEEAANLLALQTRQQLSSTALSMASQQDQSVLRLF
ncbi:flagellin [Pelagibacterium luteolum]|uniref:Flagellin n=1 Tax=Pelagibacterium luteolum TaxID=440168 RepID=A0A1G7UDY4_9HYPH|nr:flagellin [Pelagibacterium luteolum]SDG45548.1 flagellin N-terminal helical region [Pelagibacterium luteolum]